MNIKVERKTITNINLGNGHKLCECDEVVFIANGLCHYGMFLGITKRGCLEFLGKVNGKEVRFSVKPSSIEELEKVN